MKTSIKNVHFLKFNLNILKLFQRGLYYPGLLHIEGGRVLLRTTKNNNSQNGFYF